MKLVNKGKLKQRLWNTNRKLWSKDDIVELIDKSPVIDVILCHNCIHLVYDEACDRYICGLHQTEQLQMDFCSAGIKRSYHD